MRTSNTDAAPWFRRLWWVNGVLLCVTLVAILGILGYSALTEVRWRAGSPGVAPTSVSPTADPPERAVRYGLPRQIVGTSTELVVVHYGSSDVAPSGYGVTGPAAPAIRQGPQINVVFVNPETGAAHLLLDRPAFIRAINYPRNRSDSLRSWITYEIAFEDRDQSGDLNGQDPAQLYISDLEGQGFRSILPSGWLVRSHRPWGASAILVLALEEPAGRAVDEAEMPQRAFLYDVSADLLTPFEALDVLIAQAARLVSGAGR